MLEQGLYEQVVNREIAEELYTAICTVVKSAFTGAGHAYE